jgi:hypothetical protein
MRFRRTEFKFRSYDPSTGQARKHIKAVDEADTVEKATATLAKEAIAADEERRKQELDLINIQPKKPNWDLKRDLEKRLEKLKPKTQAAMYTLIRMFKESLALEKGLMRLSARSKIGRCAEGQKYDRSERRRSRCRRGSREADDGRGSWCHVRRRRSIAGLGRDVAVSSGRKMLLYHQDPQKERYLDRLQQAKRQRDLPTIKGLLRRSTSSSSYAIGSLRDSRGSFCLVNVHLCDTSVEGV